MFFYSSAASPLKDLKVFKVFKAIKVFKALSALSAFRAPCYYSSAPSSSPSVGYFLKG